MDPVVQAILLRVVLPAVALCLAGIFLMLVLKKKSPAIAAAVGALAGVQAYLFHVSPIGDPSTATWHVLFSGAIVAGLAGIVIELMPQRWQIRLPAYVAGALLCAIWSAPRPPAGNPQLLAYIAGTFGVSAMWLIVLRLPARLYPPFSALAALCIVTLVAGASIMLAGNITQGGHLLAMSVPLGAMAAATIFPKLRPVAIGALTPAGLAIPGVLAMSHFYNEPGHAIEPLLFYLAAVAPLAVGIGLIPVLRKHKVIGALAGVLIAAGVIGYGGKIANEPALARVSGPGREYKSDSGETIERSVPKKPPPGSSIE